VGPEQNENDKRFVFVGIYNHRRYWNDLGDVVEAEANITLRSDLDFRREHLPSSWIEGLYDPFLDLRSLDITQEGIYPQGEQYIYDLNLDGRETLRMEVKLFKSRLTLLHIENVAQASRMLIQFMPGPNITHVLSSSQAAPKTFFDFDNIHTQVQRSVTIPSFNKPYIWCAIFGAADGYVQVVAKSFGEHPETSPPLGFAMVCVLGLVGGLVVLALIYGGAQKIGERFGADSSVPLSERFVNLVRNQKPHESTASLTRAGSLSGYIGSDVIDRSVEDQYLHRGGIGDDGI